MHPEEFASRPSSPRWEIPRETPHSIRAASHEQAGYPLRLASVWASEILEPRVLALSRTTFELTQLCSDSTVETQSILELLATWVFVTGANSGKLQPNLLAWLNSSQALEYAVKNQRKDVIQDLLNYGLIPNMGTVSALLDHIRGSKDISILELLIDGGWDINSVFNRSRPSIMSCLVENKSLVEWCLSRGGDPNGSSPSKTTVLHRAACIGSVETLKVLIAAGGQIKSPCPSDDVVAQAVSSHDESNDRTAAIHYLLDHGADIDAYWGQNYDLDHPLEMIMGKQTALHIAIGDENQPLVEMLLKRGADPRKPMWSYSTAYYTLREQSRNLHWQDHMNRIDPIEYARSRGFEGIAAILQNSLT